MTAHRGDKSPPRSQLNYRGGHESNEKGLQELEARKKLYEYEVELPEHLQKEQKINIIAFRKFGFGGIGTFHSHVTQFPFRGHD